MKDRFTRITFKNYKALKRFSVKLNEFNVLVGPNNAGKSTIVGSFRILSEGIRKASARKAEYITEFGINNYGYYVPLDDLPVATENIFTDYDDTIPAEIEFSLASKNKLKLFFPENDVCIMICEPISKTVTTPADFKKTYRSTVGFVPVLGPVEHNEQMYQKEAARLALLTHRASRNFRNIWWHYPDDFNEFKNLIQSTWPGMDIDPPELDSTYKKPVLHMFCPENRFPREIFWAGFGFQVWCQMLTYIVRSKDDSLLIIDEPDIYLHSDLQRQLVDILRNIAPDILIATHSTEIISEADPGDLLVINKKRQSAKRIKNPTQLQSIFGVLGSNLNPTLTQLAKSKRVIFLEGKDFQILSSFARKLEKSTLANRTDFAVIPVEGFNPQKVLNFSEGIELTLGSKILKAIVFDRDYRSTEEVANLIQDFKSFAALAHIHNRKEIENYLLNINVLDRAIRKRIEEREERTGKQITFDKDIISILEEITQKMKSHVNAQFLSNSQKFLKSIKPNLDPATINQELIEDFDNKWQTLESRLNIIPGKELLSKLNEYLQETFGITITNLYILSLMKKEEVPEEIVSLIEELDKFRNTDI